MNELLELQRDIVDAPVSPPARDRGRIPALATAVGLLLSLVAMASLTGITLVHGSPTPTNDQRSKQPRKTDPDQHARYSRKSVNRSLGSRFRAERPPAGPVVARSRAHSAQAIATRVARSVSLFPLGRPARALRQGEDRSFAVRVTAPALRAHPNFDGLVRLSLCVGLRHATVLRRPCVVRTIDPRKATRFRAIYSYRARSEGVIRASVTVRATVDGRPRVMVDEPKKPFVVGDVHVSGWQRAEAWWKRADGVATELLALIAALVGVIVTLRRLRRKQDQDLDPSVAQ